MWFRSDSRSFSRASGCAVFWTVALVLAAPVQAEPPNSTPAQRPVHSIQEALRLGLVTDQQKPVVGERILREGGKSLDDKLTFAFRTTLARKPDEHERGILGRIFADQLTKYTADANAAAPVIQHRSHPGPNSVHVASPAAWLC